MVLLCDLVQHVITNAAAANMRRRTRVCVDEISSEDKDDAESRLFMLFEKQSVWTKKALQEALDIDSKLMTVLLRECCVRENKLKWSIHPDYRG